ARPGRVQLGIEDLGAVGVCGGQQLAVDVDDAALANETATALFADAIDGGEVDVVFQRPRLYQVLDRAHRPGRPVRRQHHQVGAEQHEHAGRFGKAAVVADGHADAQAAQVVDGKRPIARRGETIHAQVGQVDLAIA